jgi:hypothetical protein
MGLDSGRKTWLPAVTEFHQMLGKVEVMAIIFVQGKERTGMWQVLEPHQGEAGLVGYSTGGSCHYPEWASRNQNATLCVLSTRGQQCLIAEERPGEERVCSQTGLHYWSIIFQRQNLFLFSLPFAQRNNLDLDSNQVNCQIRNGDFRNSVIFFLGWKFYRLCIFCILEI